MALFGSKKKDTVKAAGVIKAVAVKSGSTKPVKVAKVAKAAAVKATTKAVVAPVVKDNFVAVSATSVIIRPHITEKSGLLSQSGVYTFVITRNANKDSIAKAIKTLFKVTPVKIALLNNPAKKVFVRGKRGSVAGIRKAVITVKKGEKIDFV